MRRIVYLAIGFAAACGLCLYADKWFYHIAGIGVLLLLNVLRKPGALRRCLLTLVGIALGYGWFAGYSAWNLRPVNPLDGQVAACTIRVSDYERTTDYGSAVDGRVVLSGKTYRITAYLNQTHSLKPGDTITGSFRMRVTTQAGEEPSSYYQGKGIFLLAYQKGEIEINNHPKSLRDAPAVLRNRIQRILEESIPSDCVAFAKALLLGDTSELTYETDTNLKVSGIRHVVAVSGLHISIFFSILSLVTFRKRFLSAAAGIPLLFLFAAVAGFTPSVTRACIMSVLMLIAQLTNREYDGPSALAFAVLVMLIFNPYCIGSVSFQLSVASVAGILLFAPGIRERLTVRLKDKKGRGVAFLRKLAAGVSVTLAAQALTVPLCAYYFGMVSLVGVLTNLLVLWVVSIIFCLLAAVCVLSLLWGKLAAAAGLAAGLLIRYVLFVAKTMAAFPLAAVYTVSPYTVLWLVYVYALIVLCALIGKRLNGAMACCVVLMLCVSLMASWLETTTSDVRFTVLDVGQGQCLLLHSEGRIYMVDCGGDSDSRAADLAAETLLSQGYSHVDALILTHTDRDHAGGARNFMSRIRTDLLITSVDAFDVPADTQVVMAQQDVQIRDGNTVITVFAPVFTGESNEMSLCVLFDTEKCDILVTGDRNAFGERSLLRHSNIPTVDILVAGHHGSKYSNSEALLAAAQPEIVCVSAGADNSYGHPALEALERFEKYGCVVYRTDRQGTITIRR